MEITNLDSLINHIKSINKPTLFLVVGLPYSGKSHTSKYISEKLNIERVSFDETWQNLADNNIKPDWEMVNKNNLEKCRYALSMNKHIILDTYTDSLEGRDFYKEFAENNIGSFSIIYLKKDIEKCRLRHEENKISNSRHSISDQDLEKEIKNFVEPIIDQDCIIINL